MQKRIFLGKIILAVACLVWACSLPSCTVALTEQAGEVRVPVSGLWIAQSDEPQRSLLLYIASPGEGDYPFRFQVWELYKRNLLVAGRRIFVSKRRGQISSSPNQLLLYQDVFIDGFYAVQGEKEEPWALSGFSRFVTERNIKKQKPFVLLTLTKDGNTLEGADYPFVRALRSPLSGLYLAETDVALVLEVYPDQKTLRYISFSPSFSVLHARRKLYSNLKNSNSNSNSKEELSDAKSRRRASAPIVKIVKIYDNFGEAKLLRGKARAGDLLVLPSFRPGKISKRRRLSRSEVLRRIQRGEHVPREDLIRVLGDKKR